MATRITIALAVSLAVAGLWAALNRRPAEELRPPGPVSGTRPLPGITVPPGAFALVPDCDPIDGPLTGRWRLRGRVGAALFRAEWHLACRGGRFYDELLGGGAVSVIPGWPSCLLWEPAEGPARSWVVEPRTRHHLVLYDPAGLLYDAWRVAGSDTEMVTAGAAAPARQRHPIRFPLPRPGYHDTADYNPRQPRPGGVRGAGRGARVSLVRGPHDPPRT